MASLTLPVIVSSVRESGPGLRAPSVSTGGTVSGRFTVKVVDVALCPGAVAESFTSVLPKPTVRLIW